MKLSISVAFFCGSALAATAGYFTQQHYLGRQRLLDNLKHAPPLSSLEELNQEQEEKERIGAFFHQYQRVDEQDEAETLRADEDYDVDEGASQQQLDERKLSRREGFRKVMGNLALPPQYKPFHPQFLESPTPGSIGRPSGHEEQQLVAQRGAAMYELQMTRNYQTTETRTNNKGEKYTHTNHHSTPLCHYKISTPIFIGPDTLNDDALNLVDADNQEARDDQPVQSVQAIQLLDLPKDAFFLPKMQAVVQTTRTSIPKIPSVEDTLHAISESHEATVKDAIVIHRSGPFNSTNGTTSSYSISEKVLPLGTRVYAYGKIFYDDVEKRFKMENVQFITNKNQSEMEDALATSAILSALGAAVLYTAGALLFIMGSVRSLRKAKQISLRSSAFMRRISATKKE